MYQFLLNMYVEGRITEAKLRSYVPLFITQEECDLILATPQI